VSVRFRFPDDRETGAPGRVVVSEWLVIPVTYEYAHLGFKDIHDNFFVATDAAEMFFADRA
jgi:hypothetical protein